MKTYMPQYDPEDVYSHIRCELAHNFVIGGNVALTNSSPGLHDPMGARGRKIINFEDFFQDFQTAANSYFNDLAFGSALQANFEKRVALGLPGTESI